LVLFFKKEPFLPPPLAATRIETMPPSLRFVASAAAAPGGNECVIIAALADLPHPVPGFGSTDCRCCRSHLLAWPKCCTTRAQLAAAIAQSGATAPLPGRNGCRKRQGCNGE
jgi:hypothetical protein